VSALIYEVIGAGRVTAPAICLLALNRIMRATSALVPSQKMAAGNQLVVADNKITGITLAANQPLRLRVVLNRLGATGIIRLGTVHQIADRIILKMDLPAMNQPIIAFISNANPTEGCFGFDCANHP
jgi:hypothetical protein